MPFLAGEPVAQFPTEPAGLYVDTVFLPNEMKVLTANNGENLRVAVLDRVKVLAEYILHNRIDDTKSMTEIVGILRALLLVRGVDEKAFHPMLLTYKQNKQNLMDPVRGPAANIEAIAEDSLIFMHTVSPLIFY